MSQTTDIRTGEVTGVRFVAFNPESHRAAMIAAGYVPTAGNVGDRVLVSLSNGWEGFGEVVKVFKNGARRVRDGDRGHNRRLSDLWLPEPKAGVL